MSKIKIEAGNRYNENGLAWELLYFRLAAGTIKQVEKGGHLYCLTMGRIQKKGWVTMQEAKEKVSVQNAAAYGRSGLTSDHYRKAVFEAGYDAGFIYFINSSQHNCGSFLRNQLEQN